MIERGSSATRTGAHLLDRERPGTGKLAHRNQSSCDAKQSAGDSNDIHEHRLRPSIAYVAFGEAVAMLALGLRYLGVLWLGSLIVIDATTGM